jgi:hypothetical protein
MDRLALLQGGRPGATPRFPAKTAPAQRRAS